MTECLPPVRKSFRVRKAGTYLVISLLLLALGARVYSHFIPWGASLLPFWLASIEGPDVHSPDNSRTLKVYFNDAGAMHSGKHWTWVIEGHWFWGRRVVAEGYLEAGVRQGKEALPIRWTNDDTFVMDFSTNR